MATYINRTIEKKIEEMYGNFPAILITGARQSGKTTLLEYIAHSKNININEVTLDDIVARNFAQTDPEGFLEKYGTPLVIDEFNYAPNLLSYIKIKIDEARKNELFGDGKEVGTLYYLTGSQIFETMENITESLAGRVGIITLHTLSSREIEGKANITPFIPDINLLNTREKLNHKSSSEIFERIFKGGYPELYKNLKVGREEFFSSYIKTYIERDVRKVINVKDEPTFLKFVSAIAARTGQELNISDIAKDIDIERTTATKWLNVLVNTHIVFLLQPHANNNIAKLIKRPKIYFLDTGLACYLTGYVSSETLEKSAYSGSIFETYIVNEIIKSFSNNNLEPEKHLFYCRNDKGIEIDLVIIYDNTIYPIEIKKNVTPDIKAIKNFKFISNFEMNCKDGIVLCNSSDIKPYNNNAYMIPIEYI